MHSVLVFQHPVIDFRKDSKCYVVYVLRERIELRIMFQGDDYWRQLSSLYTAVFYEFIIWSEDMYNSELN